jgi:peptidoglycan/LPS O-acetylase OafA/YrhL
MTLEARKEHQTGPYRPGRHFAPLDGLRGVAILFVLVAHYRIILGSGLVDRVISAVEGFGVSGVDLFFVLSGFLITGILIDAKGGPNYFLSFYMRRTLRIFPLYYGYLTVMLLVLPHARGLFLGLIHQHPPPIPHQAWFWLYGSNIAISIFPNFNTPGFEHLWSLAVEEQFYLVWPLLVLLTSRRWLARICVAMVLLAPFVRWLCWMAHSIEGSTRLMPSRMDTLALGGLLALAVRDPRWNMILRRHCGWIMATTGPVIVAILIWKQDWMTWDIWIDTIGLSMVACFSAALMVKILAAEPGLTSRFFRSSVLRSIGKYSYGIYVLHLTVAHLLAPVIERHMSAIPLLSGSLILQQIVIFGLLSVSSFGLAWCSWHGFEKWFLLLKSKFPYRDKAVA